MQDPTTSTGDTPAQLEAAVREAAAAGRHREVEPLIRRLDAVDPGRAERVLAELFGPAG